MNCQSTASYLRTRLVERQRFVATDTGYSVLSRLHPRRCAAAQGLGYAEMMNYSIHKMPTKVSLTGLASFGLYFVAAVGLFRHSELFFLILGGGFIGLVMLFIRSIACLFFSTFTVTESSIETVTSMGGIISIRFDSLDWERTHLSEIGLLLVPQAGESISLSILEYSRQDIAKLAEHIGIDSSGWLRHPGSFTRGQIIHSSRRVQRNPTPALVLQGAPLKFEDFIESACAILREDPSASFIPTIWVGKEILVVESILRSVSDMAALNAMADGLGLSQAGSYFSVSVEPGLVLAGERVDDAWRFLQIKSGAEGPTVTRVARPMWFCDAA